MTRGSCSLFSFHTFTNLCWCVFSLVCGCGVEDHYQLCLTRINWTTTTDTGQCIICVSACISDLGFTRLLSLTRTHSRTQGRKQLNQCEVLSICLHDMSFRCHFFVILTFLWYIQFLFHVSLHWDSFSPVNIHRSVTLSIHFQFPTSPFILSLTHTLPTLCR